MLPVISTRELSNFELALSKDGYRVGTHRCSNLLDFNEIPTEYGFITSETKNANVIGESQPYQFSEEMRGASSLRFYRNLDLEACLWEFNTYYDMSELLDQCGGQVGTDGQVCAIQNSFDVKLDCNQNFNFIQAFSLQFATPLFFFYCFLI